MWVCGLATAQSGRGDGKCYTTRTKRGTSARDFDFVASSFLSKVSLLLHLYSHGALRTSVHGRTASMTLDLQQ
jgi:hypothetical protein